MSTRDEVQQYWIFFDHKECYSVAEGENEHPLSHDKTCDSLSYRTGPLESRGRDEIRDSGNRVSTYSVPFKDIELLHKSNAGKDLNRESEGEGGGYIGSR